MTGLENFRAALRCAGQRQPELLMQKFENIGLNRLELTIMKLRYIDGLLIKQIAAQAVVGERWTKKVHLAATLKALDKIKASDLVELEVPLDVTARTLYL